jgi:4a-hydroxytetrahydrobiopterin dehydratase
MEKNMADLLNQTQIQERTSQLSGPTVEGKQLRCTRLFKDFTLSDRLCE